MPASGRGAVVAALDHGPRLVIGAVAERDAMTDIAARPFGTRALISRSAASGRCAVLAGAGGRIGLDIETIARVRLNATPHDYWLATSERALVEAASDQAAELACHWVLKEAYGKALGVGLGLPLDRLAFGGWGGAVVLEGDAAPAPTEGWSFGLYSYADLLIGVAQATIPLAPAGRKPPIPPLDR